MGSEVDEEATLSGLLRPTRASGAFLLRRGEGEVARGVETAGDAIEEELLDRLAALLISSLVVSSELRSDDGKATAVEIFSS